MDNKKNHPSPQAQRDFLLKLMSDGSTMSAWDWVSDERFARFLGETAIANEIRRAINSESVGAARVTWWTISGGPEIKNLRLRRLRELQRDKFVRACWIGLGPGGFSEFGIRRDRAFRIGC